MGVEKLKLVDISTNGNTQRRVCLSKPWVMELVEKYKLGDEIDPVEVVFDGKHYWLYDGFHRYEANNILGREEINAVIVKGDKNLAIELSFNVNQKHGLPLSREDKEKLVLDKRKFNKDMTIPDIAKACHVSKSFAYSVLDPKVKEKQKAVKKSSYEKISGDEKKKVIDNIRESLTRLESSPNTFEKMDDGTPSEEEILAAELAENQQKEFIQTLLDSDDKLKTAVKEVETLRNQLSALDLRMKSLLSEKQSAIRDAKILLKDNDKLRKEIKELKAKIK